GSDDEEYEWEYLYKEGEGVERGLEFGVYGLGLR
ncbi:MAG: hypothetical protein JWQ30_137, partial [Sediminibacterium sp.]|nr:hypothetical protein [Sediminibacterium sp.]